MVFSLTSQNLEEFEQHFGCDNIGADTYGRASLAILCSERFDNLKLTGMQMQALSPM